MDGQRFDEWARALAAGASRRGLLKGVLGGLGAAALAAVGRGPAGAAPNECAVGCAGFPGPQKAACKQACRACGGDVDQVCPLFGPIGITGFVCCPEGAVCDPFVGGCVETAFCPGGEPAKNCAAGITSDCGEGGFCALALAAGGDACQCVERECTGVPCATDADCAEVGGPCVSIPGCCDETAFCGVPCGQLPGGEAGARGTGWH